jgi:hypothetical protein
MTQFFKSKINRLYDFLKKKKIWYNKTGHFFITSVSNILIIYILIALCGFLFFDISIKNFIINTPSMAYWYILQFFDNPLNFLLYTCMAFFICYILGFISFAHILIEFCHDIFSIIFKKKI